MPSPELRPELQPTLSYQDYPGRPRLYNAVETIESGIIEPLSDGKIVYRPEKGSELIIDSDGVEDLVEHTINGLLERLLPGTALSDQFYQEYQIATQALMSSGPYGVYAFYPSENRLKRFMPEFWQRLSLVVSNGQLFNNPEGTLEWHEVREVFESTVVAVAGASVGNYVVHCTTSNLRPRWVKVADYKPLHVANTNRMRISTQDIGVNKAIVAAKQLHDLDPWLNILVYSEGIHEENIVNFIEGNKATGEPKATVIVEETDDPDAKIAIRKAARRYRVPVLMVTEASSIVQRDLRRFDLDPNLPLAVGISDKNLYEAKNRAEDDPGNLEKFIDFACALVGREHLTGEFEKIVRQKIKVLFSGIPQLHSATAAAGGIAAEAVCSMVLSHPLYERVLFNIRTGESNRIGVQY